MRTNLTIAIVTKNNPVRLARCLASITKQTVLPDCILVVDNDPYQTARPVLSSCTITPPVTYAHETKGSVPTARNRALALCTTPLLGFVDDDCVLGRHWVERGVEKIRSSRTAYLICTSRLLNVASTVGQALWIRQQRWVPYERRRGGGKPTPYLFDTKNVILNTGVFRRHHIVFREQFSQRGYDSADTDVGFQLAAKNIQGEFLSSLVVYHEETSSLFRFLKKAYVRGRLAFLLTQTWHLSGEFVYLPEYRLLRWFRRSRCWPVEFREIFGSMKAPQVRKLILYLLIKAYDQTYLHGFVSQAREVGIRLDFSDRTRS